MKTYGIRIFEDKNQFLSIKLSDILKEISERESFFWVILFLDGTPVQNQRKNLIEYMNQINKSSEGASIKWKELFLLSDQFDQMFETIILGCKNINLLHRYKNEKQMYKSCDIVIELIDCAFWEIYTRDKNIIQKIKVRFSKTELIKNVN